MEKLNVLLLIALAILNLSIVLVPLTGDTLLTKTSTDAFGITVTKKELTTRFWVIVVLGIVSIFVVIIQLIVSNLQLQQADQQISNLRIQLHRQSEPIIPLDVEVRYRIRLTREEFFQLFPESYLESHISSYNSNRPTNSFVINNNLAEMPIEAHEIFNGPTEIYFSKGVINFNDPQTKLGSVEIQGKSPIKNELHIDCQSTVNVSLIKKFSDMYVSNLDFLNVKTFGELLGWDLTVSLGHTKYLAEGVSATLWSGNGTYKPRRLGFDFGNSLPATDTMAQNTFQKTITPEMLRPLQSLP